MDGLKYLFARGNQEVMNMNTSVALDTPLPNLSEQHLKLIRCKTCNCYLSIGPISIDSEGFNSCGRCANTVEPPQNVNHMYELLATYVQFPCIFDSFGCAEKIRFGDARRHEAECKFRVVECPAHNCPEKQCVQVIKKHFADKHPNLVIDNARFKFPAEKDDTPAVNIINVKGLDVLLQIRPKSCGKYDLALGVFNKTPEMDDFRYSLKLTSVDNSRSLIVDMPQLTVYQPGWGYSKENVLAVDIGSLQSLLCSEQVCFELVCDESSTKGQDDKKSPSISLECNVCAESMKPPIYICKTGHSICWSCRINVHVCPTCRGQYEGARNFQLEELLTGPKSIATASQSLASPASVQDSPPSDPLKCLLNTRSCRSWRGRTLVELYVHLESQHPQCSAFWFGVEKQIAVNKFGWVFVTDFDAGMPFIVCIRLVRNESSLSCLWILETEISICAPRKSDYQFSLRASREEDGPYEFIRNLRLGLNEITPINSRFVDLTGPNPATNLIIDAKRVEPKKCPHCNRVMVS